IYMKMLQPVQSTGNQKLAHIILAVIINTGVPVGMPAPARVFVFIKMAAIKAGQTMTIFREMRWYPVKDNANTRLMAFIDEVLKVIRVAKTRCRRKQSQRLISPGTIERMLHHRQQLDMGITHVEHIRDKLPCQLAITQREHTFLP